MPALHGYFVGSVTEMRLLEVGCAECCSEPGDSAQEGVQFRSTGHRTGQMVGSGPYWQAWKGWFGMKRTYMDLGPAFPLSL